MRKRRKKMKNYISILLILLLVGCIKMTGQYMILDHVERYLPVPKELLYSKVKNSIQEEPYSLAIIGQDPNTINTDWYYHDGDNSGLFWWKKKWQERTRYQIRIFPAGERISILMIKFETEQRPNNNYPWKNIGANSDHGRGSLSALLKKIDSYAGE